jgi:hypothetical protein
VSKDLFYLRSRSWKHLQVLGVRLSPASSVRLGAAFPSCMAQDALPGTSAALGGARRRRWSNDLTLSAVSPNVNEPWHLKNALLQGSRVGEAATIVLPVKKDGQMVQTCQNITQLISTIMTTSWLHHNYIMTTSWLHHDYIDYILLSIGRGGGQTELCMRWKGQPVWFQDLPLKWSENYWLDTPQVFLPFWDRKKCD